MADTTRLKGIAANATLLIAACLIGYVLIEVIFFRFALLHWRPGLRTYLPETADILAQSSKREAVPRNYIAVLGDSYAVGLGDWRLQVDDDRGKPFHSVDVIHQELQRDVVSFGRSNSGSAEAIVRMPTRILEGSKCFIFPDIDAPSGFVVYFYEGNDVRDNLLFLQRVNRAYGGTGTEQIDRYFSDVYGSFGRWRCQFHLGDVASHVVNSYLQEFRFGEQWREMTYYSQANFIRLASGRAYAPFLEGPSPSITNAQTFDAVRVLERSLVWLRRRFPSVPVTVTYLPGALAIYRFEHDPVAFFNRPVNDGPVPFDAVSWATINRMSDLICGLVRDASVTNGAAFIDARPALREVGATQLVHGPRDWHHYNRAGYTAVGKLVAEHLHSPNAAQDDACARR